MLLKVLNAANRAARLVYCLLKPCVHSMSPLQMAFNTSAWAWAASSVRR
nr:MAG TPA: hypothetical protein [Caudoviricetes sp.]